MRPAPSFPGLGRPAENQVVLELSTRRRSLISKMVARAFPNFNF